MSDQPAAPNVPAVTSTDGYAQPMTSQLGNQAAGSQSVIYKIFIGPNGLRVLWRLLIYAALVFAIAFVSLHLRRLVGFKFSSLGDQTSPAFIIATRVELFFSMLLAAFAMAKIEGRPVGEYG